MNRDDLKKLALLRLDDAEVLIKSGKYEGAYYLCGYVIECGLKACIAKKTKEYDFPDKKAVNQSYTHDLTELLKAAGLSREIESERILKINWATVKDWSEESRYRRNTKEEAESIFSAIKDENNGVLQWLKQHW